jgi:cytochrome c-type biogenesis protein CcmH
MNIKNFNKSKLVLCIFFILLFNFFTNILISVEPDEVMQNQKQELRAREISKNIRCMVCQNQSIDDSNASLARDLRILIRNKIKEGKSNTEIYKFLTDRYGDFILLKPAMKFETIALWLLPFIFLIIGVVIIYQHNKRSKKFK